MAVHFVLDVDPIGGGNVTVDGRDVTDIIEGADLIVRPGQPTTLRLFALGGATVEGAGVVEVHHVADDADTQAEVGALLRTLDGHTLWEAMMADPTVDMSLDAGGPAGAFLAYVADAVDPQP